MAGHGEQHKDQPERRRFTPEDLQKIQSELFNVTQTTLALKSAVTTDTDAATFLENAKNLKDITKRALGVAMGRKETAYIEARHTYHAYLDQANVSSENQIDFTTKWLILQQSTDPDASESEIQRFRLSRENETIVDTFRALNEGEPALLKARRWNGPGVGSYFRLQGRQGLTFSKGELEVLIGTDSEAMDESSIEFDALSKQRVATDNGVNHPVVIELNNLAKTLVVGNDEIVRYLSHEYTPYNFSGHLKKINKKRGRGGTDDSIDSRALKADTRIYNAINSFDLTEQCAEIQAKIEVAMTKNIATALGLHPKYPGVHLLPSYFGNQIHAQLEKAQALFTDLKASSPELFEKVYDTLYFDIAHKVNSVEDYEPMILRIADFMEQLHNDAEDPQIVKPVEKNISNNPEAVQADLTTLMGISRNDSSQ